MSKIVFNYDKQIQYSYINYQQFMGGCLNTERRNYCTQCNRFMKPNEYKNHQCLKRRKSPYHPKRQSIPNKVILIPTFAQIDQFNDPGLRLVGSQIKKVKDEKFDLKIPINDQRTHFRWIKQQLYFFNPSIQNKSTQLIKKRSFQEKLTWFRFKIENLRISWEQGCQVIKVNRGNIFMSCFEQLKKVNFRKQVKIRFDDEKVEDAGGLLRQYIHLAMKELFSFETGIFQLCDTTETAYRIRWEKSIVQDFAVQYMWILGVLMGKAIFDRLPINCRLNKTILRQICGQLIHFHDIYSFDRKLYSGLKSVLNSFEVEGLYLTFSEIKIHDDGTKEELQLIPNGKNVEVTNENKKYYLSQLIHLHCKSSINDYLNKVIEGIKHVFPIDFLTIFQPHELEMVMNGPQEIDVNDWIEHTSYLGYSRDDPIIKNFWTIVKNYNQEQLGNLLHYCTGSNRVPILGFKYLESNRNTVSRFKIQKQPYNRHNPYPKGHTCFNRLELPEYETIEEMQMRLETVSKQEIIHFGLD